MSSTSADTVLVTGGSGFVGGHVIAQAPAEGCQVCVTVPSLDEEGQIRKDHAATGMHHVDVRLTSVRADRRTAPERDDRARGSWATVSRRGRRRRVPAPDRACRA
ncbi:NAD-dependent epimerase/dehydratase family protein [Streptomyces nodosus]|uniref:NAD-dependent epimerase/dehydratase family protein n=1 Tax=Streptomyces nodosus TaxID=40318 RepID=UPI00345164E1